MLSVAAHLYYVQGHPLQRPLHSLACSSEKPTLPRMQPRLYHLATTSSIDAERTMTSEPYFRWLSYDVSISIEQKSLPFECSLILNRELQKSAPWSTKFLQQLSSWRGLPFLYLASHTSQRWSPSKSTRSVSLP